MWISCKSVIEKCLQKFKLFPNLCTYKIDLKMSLKNPKKICQLFHQWKQWCWNSRSGAVCWLIVAWLTESLRAENWTWISWLGYSNHCTATSENIMNSDLRLSASISSIILLISSLHHHQWKRIFLFCVQELMLELFTLAPLHQSRNLLK